MKLVIRDDEDALADYAAGRIAAKIKEKKAKNLPCVLGLPAGRTARKTRVDRADSKRVRRARLRRVRAADDARISTPQR